MTNRKLNRLLLRQQLIRQPVKLINKLRIIITRSRAAEAGMYGAHISLLVNDDRRREALKISQHRQTLLRVTTTGGITGYQYRVLDIKMCFQLL